jgi:hypothetical protein
MNRQILNIVEAPFTIKLDMFCVDVARNIFADGRGLDEPQNSVYKLAFKIFKNLSYASP